MKDKNAVFTRCEIEYSQEYLPSRDMTIIFEDMSVNGTMYSVRERIVGFYHGEPTEEDFKKYYSKGCEAVMDEDLMEALTVTHGEEQKEESKCDYAVVVYGGFNETPEVRFQRNYPTLNQAKTAYQELEDTFRSEHQIFDNQANGGDGEVYDQKECSAMAIIKCGPFDDDECIEFKSLLDKTNLAYKYDYNKIVEYLIDNKVLKD